MVDHYIQVKARARRTPSNLFLISEMSLKWPTLITPKEVQRHENLKITLIFDCKIVLGAEFYVPNGAEGAVCLPTLPTLPFQRCGKKATLPFQRWGKKATLPTLLQSTG